MSDDGDDDGPRITFGGVELERPKPDRKSHCYREIMQMPDGEEPIVAFICGKFGPPCACGAISTNQCDFPIGEENRTCDRFCCERCAPTIGHDKNFCPEHQAAGAGENMVLFKRPVTRAELNEAARQVLEDELAANPPKRPRLQRAPKPHARWRVVKDIGCGDNLDDMTALTGWMVEAEARIHAQRLGFAHFVQTWDEYVALFRKKYPPPARKPRPRKPRG